MLAALPGNWSYYSHEGNPAHLLAMIADANDALMMMIILGSSRGGLVSVLERVVGESVSAHLIHHGRRPVVLVPEHIGAEPPAAGRGVRCHSEFRTPALEIGRRESVPL